MKEMQQVIMSTCSFSRDSPTSPLHCPTLILPAHLCDTKGHNSHLILPNGLLFSLLLCVFSVPPLSHSLRASSYSSSFFLSCLLFFWQLYHTFFSHRRHHLLSLSLSGSRRNCTFSRQRFHLLSLSRLHSPALQGNELVIFMTQSFLQLCLTPALPHLCSALSVSSPLRMK